MAHFPVSTNGQFIIGSSTGARQRAGTLTSGARTSITNGAGSALITDIAQNIGFSYSAGTFSVTAADGSALSSTNSGWINMQSASAGRSVMIQVTANQTFVDASGSSTISGNLFGFGSGDSASTTDIPFFLYAVLGTGNDISFMISRTPGMNVSPNTSNIGKTGSAVANNNYSFFALGDPTVLNYQTRPCVMIGSFRMRLTGTSGAWTVQNPTYTGGDGVGVFPFGKLFDVPQGVLGASASTHWLPLGGTAPVFSSVTYQYALTRDGMIYATYNTGSVPSPVGSGSSAQFIKPLPIDLGAVAPTMGYGVYTNNSVIYSVIAQHPGGTNTIQLTAVQSTSSVLANNNLDANFGGLRVCLFYPIKKS